MSGGGQYWNEDTQRWEDSTGSHATAEPPSAPPGWPGAGGSGADAGGSEVGSTADSGAVGAVGSVPPAPVVPPLPGGWPGAGAGSGWHGPGAGAGAGGTVVDAGGGSGASWGPPAPEGSSGASWTPPEQQATGGGGLSRRLVWSVVVGAAVVGVAVSLVMTLVVGRSGGGHKEPVAAGSSTTASESPTRSPSPLVEDTTTSSPSPSAPPAGYQLRDDEEGFRIAVPEGWTRTTAPSLFGIDVVNYRSADSTHRLQVYQVQEGSPQASFDLYLSDQTPKPAGFKKLRLQTLDDGQFTGSRLEYLAGTIKGEPDVGTWHVYDERFVAQDGNIYAIASYGPVSDGRDDELAKLTAALDWFCPPNTTCDPDPGTD